MSRSLTLSDLTYALRMSPWRADIFHQRESTIMNLTIIICSIQANFNVSSTLISCSLRHATGLVLYLSTLLSVSSLCFEPTCYIGCVNPRIDQPFPTHHWRPTLSSLRCFAMNHQSLQVLFIDLTLFFNSFSLMALTIS